MAFLGAFPVNASLTSRVVWNPAVGSPEITGSALTLVHASDGEILGPFVGVADGANAFKVSLTLPRGGRWRMRWATTPPGGVSEDTLYAQ